MLGKVKQKNPDILFVGSHLMVAMKTIMAMKEIDFTPKMVTFSYGPTVPDFIKNLGKENSIRSCLILLILIGKNSGKR